MKRIAALSLATVLGVSVFAQTKPVTIEFFQTKPEAVNTFKVLIDKFQAENPGILVEQNCVPNPHSVLATRMAARDVPDVFMHWPHTPEFAVLCSNGYVVDLSKEPLLANVNPAFIDQVKSFTGGKAYIVPYSLNTMGVIYSKKAFKELGLSVPEDYAGFIALCKKIKAAGRTPLVFADKDLDTIDKHSKVTQGIVIPDMKSYFADVVSKKIRVTTDPAIRTVAKKILEIHEYGQENSLATSFDQALTDFVNGKATMLIQGIWVFPTIKKIAPDFEYEMFPFPSDRKQDQRVQVGFDVAFAISADAKHGPEAKKFIAFLTKPETAQKFVELDLSPSTIKGVKNPAKGYSNMVRYIDAGKEYLWATAYWPAGITLDLRSAAQTLVATKDIDAYLKEYQRIFENAGK